MIPQYISATPNNSILRKGECLSVHESLISPNQSYQAIFQEDGNLVIYASEHSVESSCDKKPLWSSNTQGEYRYHIILQNDGNLVIYSHKHGAVWDSGTPDAHSHELVMQDDGNLVLYSSNSQPFWQSHSIYNPGGSPVQHHLSHIYLLETKMTLHQIGMRHQGVRFLSFNEGKEVHISSGGLNVCKAGEFNHQYTTVIDLGSFPLHCNDSVAWCESHCRGKQYAADDICWTLTRDILSHFGFHHKRLDKGKYTDPFMLPKHFKGAFKKITSIRL